MLNQSHHILFDALTSTTDWLEDNLHSDWYHEIYIDHLWSCVTLKIRHMLCSPSFITVSQDIRGWSSKVSITAELICLTCHTGASGVIFVGSLCYRQINDQWGETLISLFVDVQISRDTQTGELQVSSDDQLIENDYMSLSYKHKLRLLADR